MFNSAIKILDKYIEKVTPYSLHSIEMARGENNWDEFYYLCDVEGDLYVVLETDYVDPTPYQVKEITSAFQLESRQVEGWLVRKDKADSDKLVPSDISPGDEKYYDLLVTSVDDSYLRHAVLKVKSLRRKSHYNPGAYGFSD